VYMYQENLHQEFEIVYKELNESPQKAHQHSFFELIYIVSGTGTQCINKNTFDYHQGHLFLITPQDCHSFEIKTTTGFFFIRFNDIYIRNQQQDRKAKNDWLQQMEFILQHASHQPGCLLCNNGDKPLVKTLVESIIREQVNREAHYTELIKQLVNTILTIVARNMTMMPVSSCQVTGLSNEPVVDIIRYIQENIYEPEKLRTELISNHFGIAQAYLGRYFKKHTGESLQQYISNYKLKLVETRLQHSDMRINEIVRELGFTDESHLNRLFKKHKGINPSSFRKLNHAAYQPVLQ